jgi:hypothetical protein
MPYSRTRRHSAISLLVFTMITAMIVIGAAGSVSAIRDYDGIHQQQHVVLLLFQGLFAILTASIAIMNGKDLLTRKEA